MKPNSNPNSKQLIFKMLAALLCPFLVCLIYCGFRHVSFFDLYLPNSFNNDVLFYYKQVEGILAHGIPMGYFGYNESHALYGSFATWNPIIFIPWIIYGAIFGWTWFSPIICNIIVFSVALAIFVKVVNPRWISVIASFVLLMLYPGFSINLMNGLVETNIAALLLIFFAFALKCERNYHKGSIVGMFIISAVLTSCRPFMIILALLPCFFWIRNKKAKAIIPSVLVLLVEAASYFVFMHFFASPYFSGSLFNFDILTLILKGHFKEAYYALAPTIKDFFGYLGGAFSFGLTAGTQYVITLLCTLFLLISLFLKRERKCFFSVLAYIFVVAGLLGSTLIIGGKVNEGGRHIWAFSVVGIVLVSMLSEKFETLAVSLVSAGLLGVFLLKGALVPTDYDIPLPNEELRATVENLQNVFKENGIHATSELSWDNTVAVTLDANYNEQYAIPGGMGINICLPEYMEENIDKLNSGYVIVPKESADYDLSKQGYKLVYETLNISLWQRIK